MKWQKIYPLCINFLFLLSQITANSVARKNTHLLSYSSRGQKSKRGLTGLTQVLQSCVPFRGSKGECFLEFPASRGHLHALVCGPRPATASLPSLLFCFWLSGLHLSFKNPLVIALGPPGLSRITSPIWRCLIWSHLQSPLCRAKYHIHWFWGLDVDMGRGEGDGSAFLFTTLFWEFWGGPIRVESGCLPEDSLLIKVSKPSLFSSLCSFCLLPVSTPAFPG